MRPLHPPQNVYSNIQAGDFAVQHNGHVYGNQIIHYHGPPEDGIKVQRVLQTLAYPGMEDRRQDIPEAAQETYNWILDSKDKSAFSTWLSEESDDRFFWISGKAGSGKSTLMKMIGDSDRTTSLLESWAGARNLIIGHHFFWFPGTVIQKSFEGLLRGLLYQVSQRDPEIISKIVTPARWNHTKGNPRPFSMAELWACLQSLVGRSDFACCFFIDGLDEYHPHDSQLQFSKRLLELASSENVKICVASRPWETFSRLFRSVHSRVLLEDLTYEDMKTFSKTQLTEALELADPGTTLTSSNISIIAGSIADKASGVFLWTRLVVASMCERLALGASAEDLQTCLEEFPAELSTYLRTMIYDRIPPTWREGSITACALQLALLASTAKFGSSYLDRNTLHANGDAELMGWSYFWLLMETKYLSDSNSVFEMPLQRLDPFQLQQMKAAVASRLNASCGGLLHMSSGRTVSFSHRTVFDFLRSEEIHNSLRGRTPQYFDDDDFPLKLVLANCKLIGPNCGKEAWQGVFSHQLWEAAVSSEALQRTSDARIIGALDDAAAFAQENVCAYQIRHKHHHLALGDVLCNYANLESLLKTALDHHCKSYFKALVRKWPQLLANYEVVSRAWNVATGSPINRPKLQDALGIDVDLLKFMIQHGTDRRTLDSIWTFVIDKFSKRELSERLKERIWMTINVLHENDFILGDGLSAFDNSNEERAIQLRGSLSACIPDDKQEDLSQLLKLRQDRQKQEDLAHETQEIRTRLWPPVECFYTGVPLKSCWVNFLGEERFILASEKNNKAITGSYTRVGERVYKPTEYRQDDLTVWEYVGGIWEYYNRISAVQ